jgi:hypothetical protein
VRGALGAIRVGAEGSSGLMSLLVDAARAGVSEGEIVAVCSRSGGDFLETVSFGSSSRRSRVARRPVDADWVDGRARIPSVSFRPPARPGACQLAASCL